MTAAHPVSTPVPDQEASRPASMSGGAGMRVGPHARWPLPLRIGSRASPLALVQTRAVP